MKLSSIHILMRNGRGRRPGKVPQLEIDARTTRALEFAARMAKVSAGELVARLVDQASLASSSAVPASGVDPEVRVAIYAEYEGFRIKGLYEPTTGRMDITDGPLDGKSHKSPSSAAWAVVGHYKPGVSPHRNGRSFCYLDDGGKCTLQNVRHGGGLSRARLPSHSDLSAPSRA